MFSETQRKTFQERGLLRLDKLIPADTVAPARELVQQTLEQAGVWKDGGWVGDEAGGFELKTRLLRALKNTTKHSAAYKLLETAEVKEAVGVLVDGRPVRAMTNRPQILFTPPGAGDWTVPHKIWHIDVPRLGKIGLPGVQMFAFLDTVARGGGGTLVVAGSHRLLNDDGVIRSGDVKKRLKREPYFRELLKPRETDRQRLVDEPGHVGDVEVQVVELYGEPGDVFLMDLRVLHTLAPNVTRVPRLMVTQRFFLDKVLSKARESEGTR